MYQLTKLAREKYSEVSVGQTITADEIQVRETVDGQFKEVSILEIKQGDEVMLHAGGLFNLIKTSPVRDIVERTADRAVFTTQTSTYEIKKVPNNG